MAEVLIPSRARIFLFPTVSRQELGSTQPLIQWVLGALYPEVKRPGLEVETYFHLVPRLEMNGAITSLPHMSS
jgi:hypothetical protein